MKVADYIANTLVQYGIRQVFMVTGGGAMHLNHALGHHEKINCLFNHHEQASAMAAESYFRFNNELAVVNVTSGPGGTNALTGVYGAWTDSIGMLILSGQVKYATTVQSSKLPLRQLGDQEIDIVRFATPVSKYCVMVTDPASIRFHLEKAIYLAKNGRPGPCWLDIPLDVQLAQVDPEKLTGFIPEAGPQPWQSINLETTATTIMEHLYQAKRPVILAGTGIRLSGMRANFIRLAESLQIPIVTGGGTRVRRSKGVSGGVREQAVTRR